MQMFETLLNSIPKNRSEFVNDFEIPEITLSPYIWTDFEESLTTRSDSVSVLTLTTPTQEVDDTKSLNTDSSIPLTRAMTDSDIDYDRYRRYKHRRYSDPWDNLKAVQDKFPSGYLDSLHRHGVYSRYRYPWSRYYYRYGVPWSTYYRYYKPLLPYNYYDVPLPKYSGYSSYYKYYDYPLTYRYGSRYEVPYSSYGYYGRYSYLRPWRYSYSTSSDYIDDVLRESRIRRYSEELRQKMKRYYDDITVFGADDPGLTRLEQALLDIEWKNFDYSDTVSV